METLIIIWTICIAFLFFAYAGIILFMGFHRRNIKFRELLGIYIFAIPLAPLALFFLPLIMWVWVYYLLEEAKADDEKFVESLSEKILKAQKKS